MQMRSQLGRVRGLGSAKHGVAHWWAQRVTAIALIPLSLWFVASVVSLGGADYSTYRLWINEHGNLVLLICFLIALFHHAQLGMQVVIEDYVHGEAAKITLLLATKFIAVVGALSCIVAALKVALTG